MPLETSSAYIDNMDTEAQATEASYQTFQQQSATLENADEPNEDSPLLREPEVDGDDDWKQPRGFIWIQIAIMSNVFLNAFDGTITAATYATISSEFNAANIASWLTTSCLITSTAVQPLYGRVSDIFGRRPCFFLATVIFGVGCFGCGVAKDIITLNVMRAITGVGGGGLMTMGKLTCHKIKGPAS